MQFVQEYTPFSTGRVLDVGCGGGILSEGMARMGADVTGIDAESDAINAATVHANDNGLKIRYECTPVEKFKSKAFDIITCMEMLEHVPDPISVVSACADLVKPGGSVVFSTISKTPKAFLFAIVGAEHILKLLPKGTHEYSKLIKPSELDAWSRAAGLQTQKMVGLHYNPITQGYKLAAGVDVNYMIHTIKPA
jgi:2-polyprenyl-6-hydroxyphenyl methylase/3-demethylubiquinone-9 3-methyltransferase